MGMSIEEEDRYMNACIKYLQKNMECVGYRDYIIERLNKYQKIEQILEKRHGEHIYKILDEIIRVVEDGKID